jgi:hypothetical protein
VGCIRARWKLEFSVVFVSASKILARSIGKHFLAPQLPSNPRFRFKFGIKTAIYFERIARTRQFTGYYNHSALLLIVDSLICVFLGASLPPCHNGSIQKEGCGGRAPIALLAREPINLERTRTSALGSTEKN